MITILKLKRQTFELKEYGYFYIPHRSDLYNINIKKLEKFQGLDGMSGMIFFEWKYRGLALQHCNDIRKMLDSEFSKSKRPVRDLDYYWINASTDCYLLEMHPSRKKEDSRISHLINVTILRTITMLKE